jgi:hypothetical protein
MLQVVTACNSNVTVAAVLVVAVTKLKPLPVAAFSRVILFFVTVVTVKRQVAKKQSQTFRRLKKAISPIFL